MPATAAATRVAATGARRATASRPALKPRPRAAQPRRKPAASRSATRRRSQVTPITGFVPLAVGRTAGAVGGIADSGLVVRMTRGRLWIGVLGALLVGIVALNVWALSLNASSSKVAAQTDGLKRANSALQARIAGQLSNEQVQAAAGKLGLLMPSTAGISYLSPRPGDAAVAARRLSDGDFTLGTAPAPVAPVPVAPVVPEPTAEQPATVPAEPAVTDPAAAAPTEAVPVEPAVAPAGGVGAP